MVKVALLTITDGCNYGNRLQNYALQRVVQNLGIEQVETIRRKTYRDKTLYLKMRTSVKSILKLVQGKPINRAYYMRKKAFDCFNRNYLNYSRLILSNNQAPSGLNASYDYFICGSDQIWNTYFRIINEDILNYLAFFAEKRKRIAYAASFGADTVPEEYSEIFSRELKNFHRISVRESSGMELVMQLSGQEATLVLDPTMLLTREEWSSISRKPKYVDERSYILTYFMSGRNQQILDYIEQLKQEMHCEQVVNLDMEFIEPESIDNLDKFATSPDEFVWLISHAVCVLTDSFHATVFSILFHKPFTVFERKAKEQNNRMGGRLETLLHYFGLEEFKNSFDTPFRFPIPYDYDNVDNILDNARVSSLQFLEEAMNIKNRGGEHEN